MEAGKDNIQLSHDVEDYNKKQEIEKLRRDYRQKQYELTYGCEVDCDYDINNLPWEMALPIYIRSKTNVDSESNVETLRFSASNEPLHYLQLNYVKIENDFYENKQQIQELYSLENLKPLIGKNKIENMPLTPNFDELQRYYDMMHFDHIDLTSFKETVKKRDMLARKFIKTPANKRELEDLNSDIKYRQRSHYDTIINWLEGKCQFIAYEKYEFEDKHLLDFTDQSSLDKSLSFIHERVDKIEKALERVHNTFRDHQTAIEERKQEIKDEMEEIHKKIVELTHKEDKVAFESGITNQPLTDKMLDAQREWNVIKEAGEGYKAEMLQKVKEEAQNQADQKEAELRNVSLEELYAMRKNLTGVDISKANISPEKTDFTGVDVSGTKFETTEEMQKPQIPDFTGVDLSGVKFETTDEMQRKV